MTFYEELARLKKANKETEARIKKMGFETTGLHDAQFRMFMDFLVEMEVISSFDQSNFEMKWETFLNDRLVELEMKAQSALQDLQKKRQNARLATPPSKALLLPGNSGRGRRVVRDQGPPTGA